MLARNIFTQSVVLGATFLLVLAATGWAAQENPYRLRQGASGETCLECHIDAQEFNQQKNVHDPVKSGDCTACHSPHASDHGALLKSEMEPLCLECHSDVLPDDALTVHGVITEQGCTACHDPHASAYASQLLEPSQVICLGCHDEIQRLVKSANVHAPAKDSCLTCHDPHASQSTPRLLSEKEPELCLGCHKSTTKNFKRQHMNYPVETARCTSCHDPHGSEEPGLFPAVTHSPVSKRMCNQCHAEPGDAEPFSVQAKGYKLCQTCHNRSVNEILNGAFVHWPTLSGDGCLSCHTPHASVYEGMLKQNPLKVCGSCHTATLKRMSNVTTQHEPVKDGACVECHSPHAANNPMLIKQLDELDLCGSCHDWQAHASHPLGEDVKDPRNSNLTVQCSSCHDVHGTNTENMLHTDETTDLCVQCHTNYRR